MDTAGGHAAVIKTAVMIGFELKVPPVVIAEKILTASGMAEQE
jgi:hypothetical protein